MSRTLVQQYVNQSAGTPISLNRSPAIGNRYFYNVVVADSQGNVVVSNTVSITGFIPENGDFIARYANQSAGQTQSLNRSPPLSTQVWWRVEVIDSQGNIVESIVVPPTGFTAVNPATFYTRRRSRVLTLPGQPVVSTSKENYRLLPTLKE